MTTRANLSGSGRTPDEVDVHVGAQLRRIRRLRGVSQEELGRRLGVTFQQIQKYERGVNRVSASAMWKTCRALECTPNDLLPAIADGAPLIPNPAFSADGVDELATAFVRLSNPQQRAVLQLVRTMSGTSEA